MLRRRRIRGLYAVTPEQLDVGAVCARTAAALLGGARLVQYRAKGAARRALLALTRAAGVPLIVNDDLELALELGADGVHLGRDDPELAAARERLASWQILGASCYDEMSRARAAVAAGADYVAFGSFFDSSVKPDAVRAPLELIGSARRELGVPVVAIGGIDTGNVDVLLRAGVDAVAVITAVFGAADVQSAAHDFAQKFLRFGGCGGVAAANGEARRSEAS
jgi:thiamine-phosphate pyrophosphorylase